MMNIQEPHDIQRLARWLDDRRWYGDKSRVLSGAETIFRTEVPLMRDQVAIELTRLRYTSGPDADYLLVRSSDAPDEDGIESPSVRAWLLSGLGEARNLEGSDGWHLRWAPVIEGESPDSELAHESRVFRGEQSNTSIVYGDQVMMKLFRKLREGVNPEVEIGDFFTQHTDFTAFPRLMGTIELVKDDAVTTVAAVQQFIPSVGDAWTWITERIADPGIRESTVEAAHVLGVRTAEMHVAFASGKSDRFVPELASGAYAEAVRAEARSELHDTIEQLQRRGVAGASALGERLEASLDALLGLESTMITRIHGDYHLGQVLRTRDGDFAILDFEGEPSRSLAERRAKASPLRDVAGMLRSFDYAAETARRSVEVGNTSEIDAWYEASRSAMLEGYDSTVRGNSTLMRGWEAGERASVLAALEVHKALYEVRYELSNRPDWLEIPLNALRRIADQADTD
jgi:maltose alpha-D-glucosyltransferase / alpha-amylase